VPEVRIHFVLVAEGASDDGLIPHLENLCVELGATEVTGTAIDYLRLGTPVRRTVESKLRAASQLEPGANLFFIHRDSDDRDPRPRLLEIAHAVAACGLSKAWIPLVPVQETEAWILLDEGAIRAVAGRPHGRFALDLPRAGRVELLAHPKERLREALILASELTGRRLEKFRRDFPNHRRLLLQRLPVGGPLLEVAAWVGFRDRLAESIQASF
jgi:hypothetical protein